MERTIFHIDVNSAYLSWTAVEKLKQGEKTDIRLIPAIIGGDQSKRRGVVLAKSIPAKKYHIKTGEPAIYAFKKCPGLVSFPPDHALYRKYSRSLMDLLQTFSDRLEQVSVDECYMDFTDQVSRYPSAARAAEIIKDQIYEQLEFTVNIGVSSTKILAKMASDFKKPNLVHTLFPSEIKEKMWPLPVGELFMAGKSSVEKLNKLEIMTIGDLAAADPDLLSYHLKSHGRLLWEYANGIDDSPVNSTPAPAKGIGNSTTLPYDVDSEAEAKHYLKSLSESVAGRLKKAGLSAASISVEIKYHDFTSFSHQTQLSVPVQDSSAIYQSACLLFEELWNQAPIRLLGIRTTKLSDQETPVQLNLFDPIIQDNVKSQKLNKAFDHLRKKYGDDIIKKGLE